MSRNYPIYADMISKEPSLADAILKNKDISIEEVSGYFSTLNGKGAIMRIIDEQGKGGDTALHAAVRTGNPELVELMLKNGADVNALNTRKTSALNLAVPDPDPTYGKEVKDLRSCYKIQKMLIEDGAFISEKIQNKINKNALQNRFGKEAPALLHDKPEGLGKKLLNAANPFQTAKMVGKYLGDKIRPKRIETIAENHIQLQGELYDAASEGDLDNVRKCIRKGVTIDARNENGNTALMAACWAGYREIVEELVSNGADINITNFNGETAFMAACWTSHTKIAQYLMSEGVITDNKTHKQETVHTYTANNGYQPSEPFGKSGLTVKEAIPVDEGKETLLHRPKPIRGAYSAEFAGDKQAPASGISKSL